MPKPSRVTRSFSCLDLVTQRGRAERGYTVLVDAYVQGFMDSEAVEDLKGDERTCGRVASPGSRSDAEMHEAATYSSRNQVYNRERGESNPTVYPSSGELLLI